MRTFRHFRESSTRVAVITFGRFNPPTIGHQKMIDKIIAIAKRYGGDPYLFTSSSQDAKKNPLPYDEKMALMRKMFPVKGYNLFKYSAFKLSTVMFAASKLFEDGYEELIMVVGSDRVRQFRKILNDYNGVAGKPHGFYNFQKIIIESAGERDPDADGAEGMSASKLRQFAIDGDYQSFAMGIPDTVNNNDKRDVYQKLRKYMRLRVIEQMIKPAKQKVDNFIDKNNNLIEQFDIIVEYLNQLPYQSNEKIYIDKTCHYIELLKETKNYSEVKNYIEKIKSYINILEEQSGMINFDVCDLAIFDCYLEQCERPEYLMTPLNEKLQQYTLNELGDFEKLAIAGASALLLKYGYDKLLKQRFSIKARKQAIRDQIDQLKDKKRTIADPDKRKPLIQKIAKLEMELEDLKADVDDLDADIVRAKERARSDRERVKEQADLEKADTVVKKDKESSDFKKDPKIKKKEDKEREKEKEKEPEPEPEPDDDRPRDKDFDDPRHDDLKDKGRGPEDDEDDEDDEEDDEQEVKTKQTFKKYIKGNKEN